MVVKDNGNEIEVCKPITELLRQLKNAGFVITSQAISDWHFKELHFKVAGSKNEFPDRISINGIKAIIGKNEFYCTCHWSVVYIDYSFLCKFEEKTVP